MATLSEIEAAADALPPDQQAALRVPYSHTPLRKIGHSSVARTR